MNFIEMTVKLRGALGRSRVIGRAGTKALGLMPCFMAATLAIGCMGVVGCSNGEVSDAAQGVAVESDAPDEAAVSVAFELKGEGWDPETSSKAVLHIVSADGAGVDFYHAVALNSAEELELPEGAYTVTVVPAVNADGSIFRLPDAFGIVVADEGDCAIEKMADFVPAEDVSAEEMGKIASDLAEALKKGDETLAGEAGNAVVDRAVGNMANTGKVDAEAVSSVVEQAKGEVASDGSAAMVAPSGYGSTPASSSSNGSASVSNPSSSASSDSPAPSSSSAATQPQKTWVPAATRTVHHDAVYETVHHDATYTTVHHDAVTEGYSVYVCDDGYETTNGVDVDNHLKDVIREGGICGYYLDYRTRVVSPAWDETVETSPAWDEQVLVSPAWDETVVVSVGHWE